MVRIYCLLLCGVIGCATLGCGAPGPPTVPDDAIEFKEETKMNAGANTAEI